MSLSDIWFLFFQRLWPGNRQGYFIFVWWKSCSGLAFSLYENLFNCLYLKLAVNFCVAFIWIGLTLVGISNTGCCTLRGAQERMHLVEKKKILWVFAFLSLLFFLLMIQCILQLLLLVKAFCVLSWECGRHLSSHLTDGKWEAHGWEWRLCF